MNNSIRILLLEDNLYDAELVHYQLLKNGAKFEWLHVTEWNGFVEAINSYKPDVILSDYNLGGFTGIDALKFARESCPSIPFIIVTGTLNDETAADTIKKGAWDYVVKERLARLGTAIKNALLIKSEKENSAIAREKQQISEERFTLSVEGSNDGIWDWDLKTNDAYYSERWKSMLGYKDNEIDNNSNAWKALLHPDDIKHTFAVLDEHFKNKTLHFEVEFRLKCKDGSYKWILSRGKALFDSRGIPYRIAGSQTDISERKKAEKELLLAKEQAEESDKLKTAFLHNISHEIRTPLNGIVGFSEFLNDPGLTSEKRKYFTDIILKSSDQLLSIIDDIFSIASIEAGQGKVVKNEININLVATLIKEQLYVKCPNKDVTLSLKTILPDNEANIITDATKLSQILTNLVGNALKFTKQGYVNFGYTVKDKHLEFYVADSGIGIPLDLQDAIFNRFRQVETTATREYGGSGLGLSISKAYTEMLGGKMWLSSELGLGSVFYFTIPYQKVNPKQLPDIPEINELSANLKNKTLLIAEDEDSNFMLIEELLSDSSINITRAVNGIEAVDICKLNPEIDLVLMDIKMPKMDGYQATKRIKEFKPNLPIIAQTAYSTESDKKKAFSCGCSDFMVKPLKRAMLLTKITEQLI